MKDVDFYQQVLGLESPWKVSEVDLNMEDKRVTVRVVIKEGTKWGEGATGLPAHVHKWTERTWRHLDTCQFETLITARVPSVKYADGRVEEVSVPWEDRYQRVTRLLAQAVIVWLQSCQNISEVAGIMRLDWHTVNAIMKAAVERGLERREAEEIEHLGIDEKSFRRGHVYATMMSDLGRGRVWDLAEGRQEDQVVELLETLKPEQRGGVKAVAMDMWVPYEKAVRVVLPQADIVYDKFHVSAYLNKAVDAVRKEEHRELTQRGDDTLKRTKYQWLRNFPDLREQPGFQELYRMNLRTSRAWRLKETFAGFWSYSYEGAARRFFRQWHQVVKRSGLEPLKKVAEMLQRHLPGLLNYLKHRITNAAAEGLNSQVARIIANARGLGSFYTLRIRVLFFLGKLDLTVA